MAKATKRSIAEIQVINNGRQPEVKVVLPRGATFNEVVKLKSHISDVIRGLTGCAPCTSGVPVWLVESDIIQHSIQVDLGKMKSIGL